MAKSADSPHTTRRRVWRFVLGCLGVLLVVGLWPLKGYSIDETQFGTALALPQLTFYRDDRGNLENHRAMFMIEDFPTVREAREGFELLKEWAVPGSVVPGGEFKRATVFRAEGVKTGGFAMGFRIHNVSGGIAAVGDLEAPGSTHEQAVAECLEAILDGIEREIPGVSAFYNPPAWQLYYDRVRPFLSRHFSKAFPPELESSW